MEMITLNLIPKGTPPVCHASQYDKGRVIRCNLVEGLQVYVLSGETAVLNVIKPDNNIVTEALTATTGNSYIDIITTEQMCAVAGKNECEIRLTKGEVEVGTLNFIMQVEADVTTGGIESETVIHDLKTTISDMVKEEIEAISPEEELSGAMASFETHEIAPLVDCKVKIEAIQSGSGTPSPDNVRPITGFTGANIRVVGSNLWDEVVEDGYIKDGGILNPNVDSIRSKNFSPCTPNTAYYCYIPDVSGLIDGFAVCWYDINQTFISRDIKTHNVNSPANARFFKLSLYNYKNYYSSYANNVSLNYPATDTAYHAYNANSTTTAITWQDEAGTVYGGSLDVTSGLLTVTHKLVDLGTLSSWNFNSTQNFWQHVIPDIKSNTKDILCEAYAFVEKNWASMVNYEFGISGNLMRLHNDTVSTSAELETQLNGIHLVYELATPVTYQLTPTEIKTILGVNHIWADTGDIDVVYHHELTARYVYFDNTGTDLTATNVEAAIKELWSRLQ